jgi:hypothetical protein
MSDDAKIKDRPYPFDVKTAIFQLVGIAIATPKDVADIHIEINPRGNIVEVAVYVGGYDGVKEPYRPNIEIPFTWRAVPPLRP